MVHCQMNAAGDSNCVSKNETKISKISIKDNCNLQEFPLNGQISWDEVLQELCWFCLFKFHCCQEYLLHFTYSSDFPTSSVEI